MATAAWSIIFTAAKAAAEDAINAVLQSDLTMLGDRPTSFVNLPTALAAAQTAAADLLYAGMVNSKANFVRITLSGYTPDTSIDPTSGGNIPYQAATVPVSSVSVTIEELI